MPIVSVWDGYLIHHSDMNLPLCGHMLYLKEYSLSAIETEYTEGTTDNRTVRITLYIVRV